MVRRTLCNWKKHPVFDERVQQLVKRRRDRMHRYRIARDEEMVADLQRDYDLHEQVRSERGADPTMETVAGGKTGVIVRDFKSVGNGPSARVVPVYEEDHGWFKTRTHLQDQARKILGKDKAADTTIALQVNAGINLLGSPDWIALRTVLFAALERHPEAKADVLLALGEAARPEAGEVVP